MSFLCVFYKGIYDVLLYLMHVGCIQSQLIKWWSFFTAHAKVMGIWGRYGECSWLGYENASLCFRTGGSVWHWVKEFPSSELLIWLNRRPPHWDYLVICSPNFYEVAFPCVFCWFLLYNALHSYDFGGWNIPSQGLDRTHIVPYVKFSTCTLSKGTAVAFLAAQYIWNYVYSEGLCLLLGDK